jgi:hypothetical protein
VKKTRIGAFLVTFLWLPSAIDVSGYWFLKLETSAGGNAPRVEVRLTQDGDTLTGNCFIDQADDKFSLTGQVKDTAISWRCAGTGQLEAAFNGTVNAAGTEMTGSWSTPAPSSGKFTGAKRPD